MSSKTKIVVLKSRNLIWTAVVAVIVILLIILLTSALKLDQKQSKSTPVKQTSAELTAGDATASSYIPGCYATTVSLGTNTVNVIVCVDKDHINSISTSNLAQSVETMYPMVPSVLSSLEAQILSNQSLQGITYADSSQYTAVLLLEAISHSLSLAAAPEQ